MLLECSHLRRSTGRGETRFHCFLKKENIGSDACDTCEYRNASVTEYRGNRPPRWSVSAPSRGLGDTIAKVTHATGIASVVHTISAALDVDCGCDGRRDFLNKLFPYKPITTLE